MAKCTNRADHRFGFEDHARAASEGFVIHLAMPALGMRAEVVHDELDIPRVKRAPDHTDVERAREHLGEYGENVKADHTVSSLHGVTVSVPAATSIAVM